jgi:putative nucleotidyltransferase with HDIG domain
MFAVLLRMKRALAARYRERFAEWSEAPGFSRWRGALHITIALVVVAVSVLAFPLPELFVPPDFPHVGDIATENVIAPFDFPVLKSGAELEAESTKVIAETPPVLTYNRPIADSVQRTLMSFFDRSERLAATSISPRLRSERLAADFPWLDVSVLPPPRTAGGWLALRYATADIVSRLYSAGIFPDNRYLPGPENPFVVVARPSGEIPLKRDQVLDLRAATERLRREIAEIPGVDSSEQEAFVKFVGAFLAENLEFDPETTDHRRQEALTQIRPHKVRIFRGERIIAKNERVTPVHTERLVALARTRIEQRGPGNLLGIFAPIGGRVMYALFCILGVAAHFLRFRQRLLTKTSAILLLAIVWSGVLIASRFAYAAGGPALYLIPIPLAAILVTVLLDLGTGLVSTVFLSLLVGVVTGFNFAVFSVALAAGIVAAYSARSIRRRYDFYRPALYGALAYFAGICVVESLRFSSIPNILAATGYGMLNAVIGAFIAVGVLPVFESLLGFTTSLTLLELSNLNHPLLRRLALEAPGTYHHSMVIGNLSEAAAEAIGANALLARVGAYFHDIGKLDKPEYFVENQQHLRSKHEKLPPSMSALILESHVKRGRELALEFDLPDAVVDFIEQHHGTTTMSFFYHKAQQQILNEPVREENFRYPGPRPQTRETAIVMLADSVEAVSRTLDDPKPGRLQNAIRKVVETKFSAGQLEECDLTLRDLTRMEDSFLQILLGVFHSRIDYPSAVRAGEPGQDQSAHAILGHPGAVENRPRPRTSRVNRPLP